MTRSHTRSKLTARQRRQLGWATLAAAAVLIALVFWLPMSDRFVAAGPPAPGGGGGNLTTGTRTLEFGLLPYLTITTTNVDIRGNPPAGQSAVTTWQWQPTPLVITILATVFGFVICLAILPRLVMRGRLPPHQCDECGYELTGLKPGTERCPECGAVLDHTARRWLHFKSSAIGLALTLTSQQSSGARGQRHHRHRHRHSLR